MFLTKKYWLKKITNLIAKNLLCNDIALHFTLACDYISLYTYKGERKDDKDYEYKCENLSTTGVLPITKESFILLEQYIYECKAQNKRGIK